MIVAGFGFRRSASLDSLQSAFDRAASGYRVDRLAAPADKCADPCLQRLAARLDLPVCPVDAATLRAARTVTQSASSQAARGTGSVAEAAALAGAGAGSSVIRPREVSEDRLATCSLAMGKPT